MADSLADRVEPQMADHVRIMWERRWAILVLALAAGLAVFVLRSAAPSSWEAGTMVRVVVRGGAQDQGEAQFLSRTYAALGRSPGVLDAAAGSLRAAGFDAGDLDERTDVVAAATPGFVRVTVSAPSPEESAAGASAVGDALVAAVAADDAAARERIAAPVRAELDALEPQLAATAPGDERRGALLERQGELRRSLDAAREARQVTAEVVEPAQLPTAPAGPHPRRDGAMAAVVTLVLAAEGFVIARRIRGGLSLVDPVREVEELLAAPAVAVAAGDRSAAAALLSFSLQHLHADPVVTVVQPGHRSAGEIAAALADVSARAGLNTLLIDADVAAARRSGSDGHAAAPGLIDVTRGLVPLNLAVHRAPTGSGAVVLPAGRSDQHATAAEAAPALPAIVDAAGADRVVVSCTSAVALEETLLVVQSCPEAVVVVIDPRQATRAALRRLSQEIGAAGGQIAGAVLFEPARRGPTRRLRRNAAPAGAAAGVGAAEAFDPPAALALPAAAEARP